MGATVSSPVSDEGGSQKKTPIHAKFKIKIPSARERRERRREKIRQDMRKQFRTLQTVESVGQTREKFLRQKQEEAQAKAKENQVECDTVRDTSYDFVDEEKDRDAGAGLDDVTRRTKAEEYKDIGNACIRENHDLKGAIVAYTKAISYLHTNHVYFNNRAAAFLLAGKFERVISDCDSSLALKEDNIKAYTRKALALGELKRVDSALECTAKALALDPHDGETLSVQETLLTLKVEKLTADISSLTSHLHPDKISTTDPDINDAVHSTAAATSVVSSSHDPPSSVHDHVSPTSPARVVPTDRIMLAPLPGSNAHIAPQKVHSHSNVASLTYPRGGISKSTYSFDVKAIAFPQSVLTTSGKIFRLQTHEIEDVLGAKWEMPSLPVPSSQEDKNEHFATDNEKLLKNIREYLIVKGGQGGVFRARNVRSGIMGGLCVWKHEVAESHLDAIACWNPLEHGGDDDWEVGDAVELLDFLPSLFMKINRSLSVASSRESSGEPRVVVSSFFKKVGTAEGIVCGGRCLAAFGQCGVAGSGGGSLILEANLPRDDGRVLELVGVRTDGMKLPFTVEVTQNNSSEGKDEFSREEESGKHGWQACLTSAVGPYAELQGSAVGITGVRLVWHSTDLHLLDGLGAARAGGGLHAELVLISRQNTSL